MMLLDWSLGWKKYIIIFIFIFMFFRGGVWGKERDGILGKNDTVQLLSNEQNSTQDE